ncbi:MAG: exonuclease domain-containing protein [Aquificaceae bacterium]|nr:exonuclease domain-containing protein [Aquificaceae bacterium]
MTSLRRWLSKKLNPTAWGEHNWEVEKKQFVDRACFVVFDTETTGLDLSSDEVLSIGAVKIQELRIDLSTSFYVLVRPDKPVRDSVKIHGITPRELEGAKSKKEACKAFLDYARGCILSGYFLRIDMSLSLIHI